MRHRLVHSILAWWRQRWGRRAHDVAREYRMLGDFMREHCSLALADLADIAGLHSSNFAPGDPGHTQFAEGKRALLLHLLEACRIDDIDVLRALDAGRPRARDHELFNEED